jgi:hypothetical protein
MRGDYQRKEGRQGEDDTFLCLTPFCFLHTLTGTFDNTDDVVMTPGNTAAFRIQHNASSVTLIALTPGITAQGTPNWWLVDNDLPAGIDSTDTDGDGQDEAAEFIANTDPNNLGDSLETQSYTKVPTGFELKWETKPDRFYHIEHSTTLAPGSWTVIASNIPPAPSGTATYIIPDSENALAFFRISVTLP